MHYPRCLHALCLNKKKKNVKKIKVRHCKNKIIELEIILGNAHFSWADG